MFRIEKEDIIDLLNDIDEGRLQLPDFQRDYVWKDVDSRRLIASVARGYPFGALLTIGTGGQTKFMARPLQGVDCGPGNAKELLLDGQQRMTSLFMATYSSQPVRTKRSHNKEVKRFYFIDMAIALDPNADFENCIIGVPEDMKLSSYEGKKPGPNLSNEEEQYEWHLFPLNMTFDFISWYHSYLSYWKVKGKNLEIRAKEFHKNVIDVIVNYKIPVIQLRSDCTSEAICLVFEKVNVGGEPLDAFELLTAKYASDDFKLRDDWNGPQGKPSLGKKSIIKGPQGLEVMSRIKPIEFLQGCTLIHTLNEREKQGSKKLKGKEISKVSCNRAALLELPCSAYQKYEKQTLDGFLEAGRFLSERQIILHKNMPYPVLIIGLAVAFALLGKEGRSAPAKAKISRWFWTAALSELFRSGSDSRLARDIPELVKWVRGAKNEPPTVAEGRFFEDKLDTLKNRTTDAFKAVYALLLQQECRDFVNGDKISTMDNAQEIVDVHHIFPKAWCEREGYGEKEYDSIVNKTPLSAVTNKELSGRAPSEYLRHIEDKYGIDPADLDKFLETHLIEPKYLRGDQFGKFLESRKEKISEVIWEAMGRRVLAGSEGNDD